MNQLNDFSTIIQNKYNSTNITKDSIYNEIMKKEKNIKEVIERVLEYDNKKEDDKLFLNTSFYNILMNIFKVLNEILDEFSTIKTINLKKFKKIIKKEKRIIYIGIFMIICAIFLALIEISDNI